MNGRELLAAVRPLEQSARAVLRMSALAHDAIRLEEALTLATGRLEETRAALAAGEVELKRLGQERVGLAAQLAAQRAAAEDETARQCAARVAEAESQMKAQRAVARQWAQRGEEAQAAHERRLAAWADEEAALKAHVEGLRDLARRMAKAAEAVPR